MSYTGRVGILIEVGPQQFVSYRLRGAEATIESQQDRNSLLPTWIRIELEGYLDSHEEAAPPEWATEPQSEIEARFQLPAGPARELEGWAHEVPGRHVE